MAGTCYRAMFQDCTGLTTPPALPATTLAGNCYRGMFLNCTALTTAPALPAVTMSVDCYREMFRGTRNMTGAVVLPATTLVATCYREMFRDSGVKEIEVGFSAWDPDNATTVWVYGVSGGGTFKCPSALPVETGDSRIPSSWTVVNTD